MEPKIKTTQKSLLEINQWQGEKIRELEERINDAYRLLDKTEIMSNTFQVYENIKKAKLRLLGDKIRELEQENAALKLGSMAPFDYERLLSWMKDSNRKPANIAFTAGYLRDAATAFEAARAFDEVRLGE
jgi:hypothetical protein